ncbi:MAG TPA: anti-sigma factor [Gemmatimonadaceae bacterium]|nr:anti-sigma factor [Gemmatimonadaceae bacterium]
MTAPCQSDERAMLHALADGELSQAERERVEAHVAECASCRSELDGIDALHAAVEERLPRHDAPAELRARVKSMVRHADDAPRLRATVPRWQMRAWRWGAIAATALLAVAVGHGLYLRARLIAPQEVALQEVVSNHVRALMPGHLYDVQSTDEHNVKPWFAGRLDFSPDVPDLSAAGFPLLGARVDYVTSHPAAALVYGRRHHVINVLSWRGQAPSGSPEEFDRNGYHVVRWGRDGTVYWATSDLAWPELREFVRLFRAAPPAPEPGGP